MIVIIAVFTSTKIDFKNVWIKDAILNKFILRKYRESSISIYKYVKPKYHINGFEMRNHINNSTKVMF